MTQTSVKLHIPFDALMEAIASLDIQQKLKLRQLLEKEINKAQEGDSEEASIPINQNLEYKLTGEILTIEEICSRYPREWVLIADTESDDQWNPIRGEVLAHSPERDQIDQVLMKFEKVKSIVIEYTGPIPENYAVLL